MSRTVAFLTLARGTAKGFSNTYRLAELGWKGVCVEASPTVFPSLAKNHAGNPDIVLVNAAVAPSGEWQRIAAAGHALSKQHTYTRRIASLVQELARLREQRCHGC